ncbi:AAA family ATPase [Vibrio rumoiensis]|uniref:endopeptidase La n=1 Tax=Vibrio rumoiensis 1S-45 TaxID=1188252 RepID=A0A1E5E6P3_9VIBR|nr:Lon protease family protein [Vibrio rumoiensis]OEF30187.1 ATP-dependent protease [Vibrio rumoiensis 1S-45]
MIKESWQSAIPNFDQFKDELSNIDAIPALSFLDLQPRLKSSLIRFDQVNDFPRFLLINSPDNFIYRQAITQSYEDLKAEQQISQVPIITSDSIEPEDLFGQYQVKDGEVVNFTSGLLDKANGGYLIISANLILANPRSWPKLKSALLGESCPAISSDPRQIAPNPPVKNYDVKLVIVGDRNQLGDLEHFDSDFRSQLCIFGEVELEVKASKKSFKQYLGYVKGLIEQNRLPQLQDSEAWEVLLKHGTRETEDQERLPLCLIWHKGLLAEASIEAQHQPIKSIHLLKALTHKEYRQSYLPMRAIDDILEGQVIIETQGERVGQVNGLTVIEIPGHPVTYGEPARISCVIHLGDGDITDVERKAELGGNLHAKGMMIMQAFLASALQLDEPLPFSASIVFEQSYSEVDGDSASLAELCSLLSALSGYPINQEIAVTGAIDQFGRVQAVGGLNEKIEGFFHVCQHQGLTGHQGIVLPKTNLKHLSLHQDVITAIKAEQFHIWSVESVDEALPVIFGKAFRGEDDDTILNKISERIEHFDKHEHNPCSFLNKIKNFIGFH